MKKIGSSRVRLRAIATICLAGLWGCAAGPWPVSAGTPPNIVAACHEQAVMRVDNDTGNLQERTGSEIAGAADDTIEDARAAKETDSQSPGRAEAYFYQCLDLNYISSDTQT